MQAEFHTWLTGLMESGNITRQEAVSMLPPLFLDVQPKHMVSRALPHIRLGARIGYRDERLRTKFTGALYNIDTTVTARTAFACPYHTHGCPS